MNDPMNLSQAVRAVVLGERDWRDLKDLGVTIHMGDAGVTIMGAPVDPIAVGAVELARGWLRHASNERALREWARFLHGAISLVELDVDQHPLGERLLDGLWRLNFGEPVQEEMHEIARRVLITEVTP